MKMSEFMTSDSPYLCKEMLWDTPVVVTIDRVEGGHKVSVPNSNKKEIRKVMFFTEAKLGLVINAGHRKFLRRLFGGRNTNEWKGRRVMLYVEPTAKYAGEEVGGIRMALRTSKGVEWSGSEPRGKGPPADAEPPGLEGAAPAAAPPAAATAAPPAAASADQRSEDPDDYDRSQ